MRKPVTNEALDYFGRGLMKDVRDRTIRESDMIIDGKMGGRIARVAAAKLAGMRQQDIEACRWMVAQTVDRTLHNLLAWLDWEKTVGVIVSVGPGKPTNAREASDHLPSELFTEDGWIMRFSQERYDQEATEGPSKSEG